MGQQRLRADRFNLLLDIAVTPDNGENVFDFYSINVSESGMLIGSNLELNLGQSDLRMVIDPLEKYLNYSILCKFEIMRHARFDQFVENEVGLNPEKFKTLIGVQLYFSNAQIQEIYSSHFPKFLALA